MKFTALSIFFSICISCFADDTNIIVKTEWSESVGLRNLETGHDISIRGRLLIVAGSEPAYGGPKTDNAAMTFVELQNVTGAVCEDVDVYFDKVKLKCTLTDEKGKDISKPVDKLAAGSEIRGPDSCWITLPYNSTSRLFVGSGGKSPLSVNSYGIIWNHWSISSDDTNTYYLSGTLEICTRTNEMAIRMPSYYEKNCKKTLIFPKVKISVPK